MERIVVLGGGESGCGSAVLALKQGFEVFLSDAGEIAAKYIKLLNQWNILYEQGGHTEALILNASQIIKSPGIPDTVPLIRAAREKGIPVICEIEFAARYTDAKTIVITGSNGKTTTTTLIHKILLDAGCNVGLAGNIGESFALQVATTDRDWYVIELSSFQLDGMFDFRADVAVLLNITPDHLDRYEYKMENYIASKMRVVQNQRPEDFFIYSGDDMVIRAQIKGREMRLLPFSVKYCSVQGAWLHENIFRAKIEDRCVEMNIDDLKIKGIHNLYNAMASSLAALAAGIDPERIKASLESFTGVNHRLEPVAVIDEVEFINDSKATNVDSVWYALQSMTRPVIWIAGGTDKGNDYEPLKQFAKEKVKALICLGVDNSKIISSFGDCVSEIVETHSMHEAVLAAVDIAEAGDVVLLSPACASFDLFRNYEDRGNQFKEEINELTNIKNG